MYVQMLDIYIENIEKIGYFRKYHYIFQPWLRAIIGSKSVILFQRGPVDPKFQVEGVAPQAFFFSEN